MSRQIFEITLMNLRNINSRRGAASVIVVGIAGVVAVLVGLLSMSAGFGAALQMTSRPERALVLRDGSNTEMNSWMSVQELNIVSQLDGIAVASGELQVVVDIPAKATGMSGNVVSRGVQAAAFDVRPELRIVEGRLFEPGRTEMIVGVGVVREFAGLEIGDRLELRDASWTVVGHFESGGSANESELWMDLALAQAAFRRAGVISSVRVKLDGSGRIEETKAAIREDPRLDLSLIPEDAFYAEQSRARTTLIEALAYLVAGIMAVGSIAAALNTMYSAVASRTVEIATLRALGFGAAPVVASVMIEALVLALVGGVLGGALVFALFDGYSTSALNNASYAQVAFDFAVTPGLLLRGLVWALTLGLLGGIFPALRAARLPITTALRAR